MKKMKKVLLLVLCAALLVGATIAGTVAYLTATAKVENTFTVGHVAIDLQERKMDPESGKLDADGGLVDTIEKIKIVPGRTIEKQPVVIVEAGSEDCWLFVKIEGELLTGGSFKVNKDWAPVGEEYPNWYVYTANAGKATVNADGYQVFDSFTFQNLTNEQVAALKDGNIVVTAYAVQYELVDQDAAFTAAQGMTTPSN